MRKLAIAVVAGIIGIVPAAAQNVGLSPTFGTVTLSAGFTPDPHSVAIVAGGPIDVSSSVGGNCFGQVADAPDFRLNYTAGGLPLIISAISGDDTTLVINDPNGNWICDDDSGGNLNPQVTINNPASGTFDIWVGTFGGGTANATLNITEIGDAAGPGQPPAPQPPAQPPAGGGFPDVSLSPAFGSVNLSAGFTPDPHTVGITAGGNIDAFAALGGNCAGSIAEAPDFRLNYSAGGLPLTISAISGNDTTLVINDPNGNWICDDDSGGNLNPQVTINNPSSGTYDIWVGTFGGGSASATLNITEVGGGPGQPPAPQPPAQPPAGAGFPDPGLPPAFGSVNLSAGFTPDPHTVGITAGGSIDAFAALGGNCFGSIAEAPDFRLNYSAGGLPLIISAISGDDTTLVINDPNGNWICDDDSGGNLNPQITINNPSSGTYDIWVGTLGGGSASATLNITEVGGGPAQPAPQPPAQPPAGAGFPNPGLSPAFGGVSLAAGFVPDPHTVALVAGGDIDAFGALGGTCAGTIAEAPDFRLNYTGAVGFELVISAISADDTTLVINDPNGNWICDDDSGGNLNPLIALGDPSVSGQYDIWVGTFGGGTADATLNISENVQTAAPAPAPAPGGGKPAAPPAGPPPGGGKPAAPPAAPVAPAGPNFNLQPAFGNVALMAGFLPDPHTVAVVAGGPIDAFDALGGNCFGQIAEAPDFRINYDAGAFPLIISAISNSDTTLVINDPNGNWICDDDSAGNLNPVVRINNPQTGQYDVWIGTFGGGADATLQISEKGP